MLQIVVSLRDAMDGGETISSCDPFDNEIASSPKNGFSQ